MSRLRGLLGWFVVVVSCGFCWLIVGCVFVLLLGLWDLWLLLVLCGFG